MAFNSDLSAFRAPLKSNSFLHIEDALSPDFVQTLSDYRDRILSGALDDIEQWHIPGKKRQYLFDFPSESFLQGFLEGMGQITGARPSELTVGERHIKVYFDDAPAYPAPHQDRKASEYTIGFPIAIPDQSKVCFFPHLGSEENQAERAQFLDVGDNVDMKAFYDDEQIIKVRGKLGDMVVFYGSRVFHERINAAGSMILYTKINAIGSDPLGENRSLRESLLA
jgi:hypothetical protein